MRKAATAATFFGLILGFGYVGTAVGQARNAFFGPNVDTDQVEARVDQLMETLNGGAWKTAPTGLRETPSDDAIARTIFATRRKRIERARSNGEMRTSRRFRVSGMVV